MKLQLTVSIFPTEKELYIPGIFNKLCIKKRKTDKWEKQTEGQMKILPLFYSPVLKHEGRYKSLLQYLHLIKFNSILSTYVSCSIFCRSTKSTLQIRTLTLGSALTYWRTVILFKRNTFKIPVTNKNKIKFVKQTLNKRTILVASLNNVENKISFFRWGETGPFSR
jgi:hypothetical protein